MEREGEREREKEGESVFLGAMRAEFSGEGPMCSELCPGHCRQKEGHEPQHRGAERHGY